MQRVGQVIGLKLDQIENPDEALAPPLVEDRIFGGIVKRLRIDLLGWVRALPFGGAPEPFVWRHKLDITQFLAYAGCVHDKVLVCVGILHQVSGQAASRYRNDVTVPSHGVPNLAHPLSHREGARFAHVVDAPGCPVIGHRQGDGGCDVLDESPRRAPVRPAVVKHDGRPIVSHPLHVLVQTMLVIPWALNEGQPQDGPG